ncbi:TonB-dependent receptor domain-containing protein [Flagellimonas aurea]|uniref:TonB-dependent receptor domain-containing protein n=1 Tax=Flagellimonas aurea TaxID=2915619 RepID=UPI0035CFBC45
MKKDNSLWFKILVTVVTMVSMLPTHGQIEGKVSDKNAEPIPYVNVILYLASDTTIVQGTITNDFGEFLIWPENSGTYMLALSSLGFQTYHSLHFQMKADDKMDLGTMILEESASELDEVTVAAKRNLVQNTSIGKVINVQSSIMTKGSNALQVLERLPGVLMDKRNNQYSLNGQNGVTVMFNGRRVPMSMEEVMALLESTLADTIEKVELITSPTAKYDADGGAGIINIVFKKNEYEGSQLNMNTTVGYGYREKGSGSLQYTYAKNELNLNASYSISHNRGKNGFEGSGTSNMSILGGENFTDFSTFFDYNNNSHSLNLGSAYQLTSKTEVGAELAYSFSKNISLANISNERLINEEDFQRSHILTDGKTRKNNLISSVYLASSITEKSRISLDLSYLNYNNDSPATTQSEYFDQEGNEIDPDNDIFTDGNRGQSFSSIQFGVFKTDYSLKLNEKIESEFGFKGSYALNENDSKIETNNNGVWEVDPRSQSLISSEERLWAAYYQFKYMVDEKSTVNAGLRYENWNRTISNTADSFKIKQFFPSFSYQYLLGENRNLNFNYHRRISRPSYADLVTSLYYNDPTAIFTGNPLLNPAITNTLQMDYSYLGFNIGLSLQKEANPILRNQFTSTPQNDILIVSPQNGDFQKSVNIFLTVPWQWAQWAKLNVNSTSSFRKYKISYISDPAEKSYFFQSLNFNQSIELPFEMNMEFSGWYNFPSYNGSHITKGFGIVNFGLTKKVKNNWGTLQFTINDLFKSFNVYTHNGGMAPVVFDIDTKSRYRDESSFSRTFRLSYSISFGNRTTKNKRGAKSVEELNRVD